MPPNIWQHVFGKSGWEIEFIGPETVLDTGEVIVAGKMNLSPAILSRILLHHRTEGAAAARHCRGADDRRRRASFPKTGTRRRLDARPTPPMPRSIT